MAGDVGTFHPICGTGVELSQERRVASGKGSEHNFELLNGQIPIGLHFSVKILKESYVSPISAFSKPHASDAPYTDGDAVHVVYCFLFCIL